MQRKWLNTLTLVALVLAMLPFAAAPAPVAAAFLEETAAVPPYPDEVSQISLAFVQVAHLAPFAEDASVDVAVDGLRILFDVDYGDSTGYQLLPADEYLIEVFPAGEETPVITATVELMPDTYYTAIAIGDDLNQDLELIVLEDDLTPPADDHFKIRLGHLAPFAPGDATADIRLADGTPVLTDVVYSAVTPIYFELPANTYDLIITTPGGDTTLIDPFPVAFGEGDILSAFATGDDANQDLGVFALPSGEPGDFLPLKTYTLEVHVVPPEGGTVDVDPEKEAYSLNEVVTLTALPELGWAFDSWSGDVEGTAEGITHTIVADTVVTATFTALPYGWVQVAHLAPFAEDASVSVLVDGTPVPELADVDYGDSTGYIPLAPGEYLIEVFPAGEETPAISATVGIELLGFYTAIAIGDDLNQDLELMVLEDDLTPPAQGQFKIRLGHLAPFAPGDATADIRLADGTPVLTDVVYSAVTPFYLELPANTYDLIITTPGGDTTLIDPLPVAFGEGDILSAFATGDGANHDLGVFALPAGEPGDFLPLRTYTVFMPLVVNNAVTPPAPARSRLQVAHLAPFALDAGTAVTVTLDGVPALTDFVYGDSTPYIELQAGEYEVAIWPAGSPEPAITATVELMVDAYYTAIAYGDGVNQGFGLTLLEDDLTPPEPGTFHLRLGHLAPFARGEATADIRLADGTPILEDVDFGDVSGYIPLAAGEYDIIITTPGGDTTLIDPLPVTFTEGQIVSAFATGDGDNQDLGVFALPAGELGSFLLMDD